MLRTTLPVWGNIFDELAVHDGILYHALITETVGGGAGDGDGVIHAPPTFGELCLTAAVSQSTAALSKNVLSAMF